MLILKKHLQDSLNTKPKPMALHGGPKQLAKERAQLRMLQELREEEAARLETVLIESDDVPMVP